MHSAKRLVNMSTRAAPAKRTRACWHVCKSLSVQSVVKDPGPSQFLRSDWFCSIPCSPSGSLRSGNPTTSSRAHLRYAFELRTIQPSPFYNLVSLFISGVAPQTPYRVYQYFLSLFSNGNSPQAISLYGASCHERSLSISGEI